MIEVDRLSKTYGASNGAVEAMSNISFGVKKGQFVSKKEKDEFDALMHLDGHPDSTIDAAQALGVSIGNLGQGSKKPMDPEMAEMIQAGQNQSGAQVQTAEKSEATPQQTDQTQQTQESQQQTQDQGAPQQQTQDVQPQEIQISLKAQPLLKG